MVVTTNEGTTVTAVTECNEQSVIIYDNNPCKHCSNNPQNGGSGICFCILGTKTVY